MEIDCNETQSVLADKDVEILKDVISDAVIIILWFWAVIVGTDFGAVIIGKMLNIAERFPEHS